MDKTLREYYRKTIHALGLLAVIPLWYFEPQNAVKVFALFVVLALFLHWYWDRRSLRDKYVRQMAAELPEEHRHDILKSAAQIKKFEEEILFGFLKFVKRKKEKDPLLSTFYYLLSAFLALIIFGVPFAIFGLFAIAIGDTFATIVGTQFGKHKLWYNKEKSFEGWAAFFAATAFSLFAFLQFFPQYAVINPLYIAILAGIAGATVETIPTLNDNSTIPFAAAFAVWLATLL